MGLKASSTALSVGPQEGNDDRTCPIGKIDSALPTVAGMTIPPTGGGLNITAGFFRMCRIRFAHPAAESITAS